ncbi:alpha/beta hydrolase [Glaciihabitans sp. UYNi722]|uniref:alpha/beta hydrolase n=1 Tax=Glaciihabitans sp. UYNi722 TaxID=3156344 RepID=UPI003394855B
MSIPSTPFDPSLNPRSDFVTSADGARIGYLSLGSGSSVIVVPGALSTASDYLDFARCLAAEFTVHIIERRGRGVSDPQGDEYGLDKERDDVLAVQRETGAALLVGHSFGGLIALESARASGIFEKVAVYEPGVSIDGSIPMGWLASYATHLNAGKDLDAFVAFSRGTGPDRARRLPHQLMKWLIPLFVSSERREKMYTLLPQNMLEHRAIGRAEENWRTYDHIVAPVLLMSGGKTGTSWVEETIRRLGQVLPHSERTVFDGLDHFGIDQGNPAEVAQVVRRFLRS